MDKIALKADIGTDEILAQNEAETRKPAVKKVQYDARHYLDTMLPEGVDEKNLTIRLLPFDPQGGVPFHKIWIHTVRVNKEFSSSGWKQFVCPKHNGFSDRCPYCETQEKTREQIKTETDEVKKKRLSDIEFKNRAREFWVVRCIDRDHEEDGVKFWTFPHSRKNDGIYDKILNIFKKRKENAEKKGKTMNIFSLENGKDLEITIKKDTNGKSVYSIVDADETSPLSEDIELANKWIEDTVKWNEVYTVKPYELMAIALEQKVPFYDKEKGIYVPKKTREEFLAEQLAKESSDEAKFESEIPQTAKEIEKVATSQAVSADDDEDLPF